jgi:hypothetical protein
MFIMYCLLFKRMYKVYINTTGYNPLKLESVILTLRMISE